MLLIRSTWVPIIVALHHLIVLVVDQIVVLSLALHVLPAALALLFWVTPLCSLVVLLILEVEPVVSLFKMPAVWTNFRICMLIVLVSCVRHVVVRLDE